jgi:hypothetical protein
MAREPWYESDNPSRVARGAGWRAGLVIVAVVVFVGVIGVGIWAFRFATSDAKGRGDAVQNKNSGVNRVGAQERFHTLYNAVLAADKRIDVLAATVKALPGDVVAQTNYVGAKNFCIQAVADYDAETHKYSARDFRDPGLPYEIDQLDPKTDCQETKETPR